MTARLMTHHFCIDAGPVEIQCDVVAHNDAEAGRILIAFLDDQELVATNRWLYLTAWEVPSELPVYNVSVFWRGKRPVVRKEWETEPCGCDECRGSSTASLVECGPRPTHVERRHALATSPGCARGVPRDEKCSRGVKG